MSKAFGIVNFAGRNVHIEGMQTYRPVGAFSFLGRYRVIDFPISNMSNSGIDRIQVYIRRKPRSLTEHLGTGRHYNINSKRGKLHLLYSENGMDNDIYNNDIAAFIENMEFIEQAHEPYVVIAPSYMIYTMDYSQLLESHIESGADITLLYHSVDNAKESFLNCNILNLNKQKGVLSMEPNHGNAKNRNIFMETYVMKKDLFIELVEKAHKLSSMYTLSDIVNDACNSELDIRGIAHRGYFVLFRSLTFLPLEEIDKMDSWEGSQLNQAKEILAYELTKLVHGEEEAKKAQDSARALFSSGSAAEMPTCELTDEDFTDGKIDILTLLHKSGLVPSRSEARRAVQQGGAAVNGEKVTDTYTAYTKEDFEEDFVLRRGKRKEKFP